jgi:hypothetical protein
LLALSEHCHIQPSEWDIMPFSQMQFMINEKLNAKSENADDTTQHPSIDNMMASQQSMLNNMKSIGKSFKLPKISM